MKQEKTPMVTKLIIGVSLWLILVFIEYFFVLLSIISLGFFILGCQKAGGVRPFLVGSPIFTFLRNKFKELEGHEAIKLLGRMLAGILRLCARWDLYKRSLFGLKTVIKSLDKLFEALATIIVAVPIALGLFVWGMLIECTTIILSVAEFFIEAWQFGRSRWVEMGKRLFLSTVLSSVAVLLVSVFFILDSSLGREFAALAIFPGVLWYLFIDYIVITILRWYRDRKKK